MMGRRQFWRLALWLMALPVAAQQKAIVEKGQAKVCDDDPVECPLGHATCRSINAPVVVGNDSYQNPDVGQLRDFHLMRCEVCHVLFTRE